MARSYPESCVVHGSLVGYALAQRAGGVYFAYFRGPDGSRKEKITNQTGREKARTAAVAIIDREYNPGTSVEKVGWDEAVARLKVAVEANGRRGKTLDSYVKHVTAFSHWSGTKGPADVTPALAAKYRHHLQTKKCRAGKVGQSPHTVVSTLGTLTSVWHRWFVTELKICATNPWAEVDPPKTDEPVVRFADDATVEKFLAWLADRFPGWAMPTVLVRVKLQTGCRVADLCALRSADVNGRNVTFQGQDTKGRRSRTIPLSADLAEAVEGVKGRTYLWDRHPAELRDALKANGWPTHRLARDFSPARLAGWIMTVFADFNRAHPGHRLTSHLFRKRAFTLASLAGVDSRDASIAFACHPDTAARHYNAVDRTQIAARVADRLAGQLDRLASSQQIPTTLAG
jgi:site-specific recombinase XerD